jgi:hypothetical protein
MPRSPRGKKQIAKLSKRQQGYAIGQQVLGLISNLAKDIRAVMERGVGKHAVTGEEVPLPCSVADVKASLTPDQLGAVEEFISTWYVEPEKPEQKAPKK